LPMHGVARAPAEPAFGDRGGHATHWLRPHRYRGHAKLHARRMLCVEVRSVGAKLVTADPAIPIGTNRRRCAHGAGPDVSNALLPRIACRKPIRNIYKERLPVADSSDQRRSASTSAFLFLEKTTTGLDTKSGQSGAANGSATAQPASGAAYAARTSSSATTTAASRHVVMVSELTVRPSNLATGLLRHQRRRT
jgi:hypothetical protein